MNVRPILSLIANATQNYATEQLSRRYKKLGLLLTLGYMALALWPYLDGVNIMTDINTVFLMSTIFVMVGAFVGPLLLESKAKAMGNAVDKLDFFGMLIGMGLGAFFAYLAVDIYGGMFTEQIGDFSYAVIALLASMPLSMLITLLAQAFMGDSWSINVLDYNKDGKIDWKDVKAFIANHKSDVAEIQEIAAEVTSIGTEAKEIIK